MEQFVKSTLKIDEKRKELVGKKQSEREESRQDVQKRGREGERKKIIEIQLELDLEREREAWSE